MYQPYRGQRALRKRTYRHLFIAILSLFILVCIVFLLFFQNKSTISLFGKELKLPWSDARSKDKIEPDAEDDFIFSIIGGGEKEPSAQPDAPANDTPPAVQNQAIKAVELPANKLHDASYLAEVAGLAEKGVNTVAVTVKDRTGNIYGVDGMKPSLDTLRAAGMKTIAIFYTYEDDAYNKNTAAALKNIENKAWRTGDGKRWLDPASAEANAYLMGNLRACKNAGFDEILLRSFGWPPIGRLDRIVYRPEKAADARADVLAAQLSAFVAEAAPMAVSVVLDDATASGGLNEASGQSVAKLYPAAARVYVPMAVQTETSSDSIRTIVSQVTGGDTAKLVPMYTAQALMPSLLAGDDAFYYDLSSTSGALSALAGG